MGVIIKIIESKPQKKWGALSVKCEIQIDEFRESIYIPCGGWWSLDDYQKQWQEGLKRLEKYNQSCLVVAVDNPQSRKFIEWWLLYKVGNKIYIRNKIIIEDIYTALIGDKPFTLYNCYDFIPEKGGCYNKDGNKISEWITDWDERVVIRE